MTSWFHFLTKDLPEGLAAVINVVLSIVVILLIAKVVIWIGQKLIRKFFVHRSKGPFRMEERKYQTLLAVTLNIWRVAVYFLAVASILDVLGLTVTTQSLLATAGIGGIAVGIGAQSVFKDLLAGIFLIFEDQIAIGDWVELDGAVGTVDHIGLRTTRVKGFRGELNIIPNGSITRVVNYSRDNILAVVDLVVSNEANINAALSLMKEGSEKYAQHNALLVEKPEVIGVTDISPAGTTLRVICKVLPLKHWVVERELRREIKNLFAQHGVPLAESAMVIPMQKG